MTLDTHPFDPADALNSEDAAREFIAAALETGDSGYIAHAFGVVMRSRGMTRIAQASGRSREQLYRSFSNQGNPTLTTLLDVLEPLGLSLTAVPAKSHESV